MALGDGIRRNIASVDPTERALLRGALTELNHRFFPGNRVDPVPGGVSWWFKQDEIHQATHVHGGPEFLPWHREIINRLEEMLRQINPQLSLHYWDWTQDPRAIPNANLGGGVTGTLNLFTSNFMGYGGSSPAPIGEPWLSAGYYVPGANPHRDVTGNPADPPRTVTRFVTGSPASATQDQAIVAAGNYATMRSLLENVHNLMHGFVNMGGAHISFRDPFVFLLHSNVDRLFALWQTDPAHLERLDSNAVYGSESGDPGLNSNIRPWSGVPPTTRPWAPPENQQVAKTYKHPSVVRPPHYDTLPMYPLPRSVACDQIVQFSGISTGSPGAYVEVYNSLSAFTSTGGFVELRFGDFTFDHSSGPTTMALDVRFVLDGKPQVATRFERGSQCRLFARVPSGFAGTHILNLEVRSVMVAGPPIDCHISGTAMLTGTSLSSFEEIQLMAYLNWCGRGFPAHDDWVDWFRAEQLRQQRIREAAYFHWLDRGRPVGDDWADWFWAEQL